MSAEVHTSSVVAGELGVVRRPYIAAKALSVREISGLNLDKFN